MQSGAGVVHCQDWFQFSLHSPSLLLIKQNKKKIIQLLWLKHKYSSLEELWHKNICPNLANSDEVPINCFLSHVLLSVQLWPKKSPFSIHIIFLSTSGYTTNHLKQKHLWRVFRRHLVTDTARLTPILTFQGFLQSLTENTGIVPWNVMIIHSSASPVHHSLSFVSLLLSSICSWFRGTK